MKMGVADISIEEVVEIGEKYYIKGQNLPSTANQSGRKI